MLPCSTVNALRPTTMAQQVVKDFVRQRCEHQLARFDETFQHVNGAFDRYEPSNATAAPDLSATHVDLPHDASTSCAAHFITPDLAQTVASIGGVMPATSPDDIWPRVNARDRKEYVKLIGRELQVHKVRLMLAPKHVAGRFVVSKRGTDRQRPV